MTDTYFRNRMTGFGKLIVWGIALGFSITVWIAAVIVLTHAAHAATEAVQSLIAMLGGVE